jgi:hypothetical protein
MQDMTGPQRQTFGFHAVFVLVSRQWSRSHGPGRLRESQTASRHWLLIQVWDGAVLAAFDDEASARKVMSCADDDDVVVLCVDK